MTPDNIRLARNPNATGRVEQMSLPEMEAALARGELSPELVAQSANEWISANSLNASGRGISPELIQRVGQLRSTAERIAAQPGRIQPRVPELQVRQMAASGTELSQEALAVLTRKQLRGYHRGLQERLEGAASLDAAERIQQLIR